MVLEDECDEGGGGSIEVVGSLSGGDCGEARLSSSGLAMRKPPSDWDRLISPFMVVSEERGRGERRPACRAAMVIARDRGGCRNDCGRLRCSPTEDAGKRAERCRVYALNRTWGASLLEETEAALEQTLGYTSIEPTDGVDQQLSSPASQRSISFLAWS